MGQGRGTAALLQSLAAYLDEWQLLLRAPHLNDERVRAMRDQAEDLRQRAEAAASGGLVHHLGVCIQCLRAPALDRRGFQAALRNLSEVAWQLKREHGGDAAPGAAGARSVALPPLLVDEPGPARAAAARGSHDPVPPPPISIAAPPPVSFPRADQPGMFGFGAPPGGRAAVPPAPRGVAPQPAASQPGPAVILPRASAAAASQEVRRPEPRAVSEPAPARPPVVIRPSSGAPSAGVEPAKARGPANLLVATMFGLRAFGRNKAQKAQPAGVAPSPLPRAPAAPPGVLGLGRKSRSEADAPPPWIGARAGGLPDLPTGGPLPAPSVEDELDARLRSLRPGRERAGKSRPSSTAGAASGAFGAGRELATGSRSRWGGPRRAPGEGLHLPWWIGLVAVAVVGLIVIVLLVWRRPMRADAEKPPAPVAAAAPAEPELPKSRLLDNKERLKALISLVHGFGGEESPELADLLDEEAALLDEVMVRRCSQSGDQCEGAVPIVAGTLKGEAPQNQIQHLFQDRKIQARSRGDRASKPSWLAGLEIPVIGVEDDPEVKHWVEYFTQHAVGRERFQAMLFRCGAYQELIEGNLIRQGLPTDLMALVLTESGCVPDIESPVGARGLWQFMPATARAYHLHVKEGVVDERISPPKATEAAIRYLSDLYRKMGSWEFAMASYNMGPFGLAARIRRAGGDVSFWDLAGAGMLPEETAKYVPRIQGYALILKNLAHFNFETAQMRAPEMTAELEAPAGTRLGQVARSVGTTLNQIKQLNPDLVGMTVPDLPGARFMVHVPKDSVFRGRGSLAKLIADGDQADRCVSSEFDWGRQRFTAQMAAQCRKEP